MSLNLRTTLPAVALLVAALPLTGCSLFRKDSATSIRLSGNIETTQVNVAFKMPGRIVELPIREGMAVRKGDLLARLDSLQLERQLEREQAAVVGAETVLEQVRTAVEYQREALAAELQLRQAELGQAEARLRDLQAGSRTQDIQTARSVLEDAKVRDGQAQRDWERADRLYKNEDISTSQYDQYRTRYENTKAAVRQAEQRLDLLVEGARKEEVEAARSQVERARAAIRMAEASRIELRRREQEVAVRQADLERARAQARLIDAQLDDTRVVSPVDGVVLIKSAEPGEVVAGGTTLATISDIEHPWLRGYVNMTDLGRVKLGQKVRITTEALPGKEQWGRISYISPEAEFTPKQIQTTEERVKLVYRIKVEVPNPKQELKSNMPADAEIMLEPSN